MVVSMWETRKRKKSGRTEEVRRTLARTCSYEVVDVALALAPLPRMESHKDEPLRAE